MADSGPGMLERASLAIGILSTTAGGVVWALSSARRRLREIEDRILRAERSMVTQETFQKALEDLIDRHDARWTDHEKTTRALVEGLGEVMRGLRKDVAQIRDHVFTLAGRPAEGDRDG